MEIIVKGRNHSCSPRLLRHVTKAIVFAVAWTNCAAWAQTVPADLVDVSIEDLFAANVVTEEERESTKRQWYLAYRYGRAEFKQYRLGTQKLSYSDVQWSGPSEPRTKDNYPVVPTEITQEVHNVLLGYQYSDKVSVRLSVPFIKQSTDHISIVPGYDAFNISSDGVGDVFTLVNYELSRSVNSAWHGVFGLSIPTGSIDEEGDTPRAPGDQQLPYTMQIGSGTWDIPLGVTYDKYGKYFNGGSDMLATIRTGNNDRDYRLGHKFTWSGWLAWAGGELFEPGMRLSYRWQGDISGEDVSLSVPNPTFPYPAPVVDPTAFGGQQLDLAVYIDLKVAAHWNLRAEYSQPLWLNLNGPQSAEKYHLGLGISTTF